MLVKRPNVQHLLSALLLSCALSLDSYAGGGPAGTPIGVNVQGSSDWEPQQTWADVIKQGRPWGPANNPAGGVVPVDSDGWPTGDAGIFLMATGLMNSTTHNDGVHRLPLAGTYKLRFTGNATARVSQPSITVQNKVYDAATNTTTADVVIGPATTQLSLSFTGQAGGVKNVQLMRPGHDFDETFNHDFIARVGHFTVLRFMQYQGKEGMGINNNNDADWSNRTRPRYATTARSNGASFEHMVELANQVNADIWVTVPLHASDDYVTKMAQLFLYGSDGELPYTSVQSNPLYPPLATEHKVYIEYVNEMWNGTYPSTGANNALAQAEHDNGNPYHYTSNAPAYLLGWQRMGRRAVEISNIFRSVFGDAAMMTRVRPVIAGNFYGRASMMEALRYVATQYPQPPSYYFYGGAGAPYFGSDREAVDNLTVDDLIADMNLWVTNRIGPQLDPNNLLSFVAGTRQYGLKLLAYEGGVGLGTRSASASAKLQAQLDPRMRDVVVNMLHSWYAAGGEDFAWFTLCAGWGAGPGAFFGLSNDISTEANPKWDAIKEIAAEPSPIQP